MAKLIVKKVYRGNGANGKIISWYANPNNPQADNVEVNKFLNSNSSASKHCYSKNRIKEMFSEYELVFIDK